MTTEAAGPRLRTRGQPAAVEAVLAMLGGGMPHALLLVGPAGVGKSTLAEDIAAGLLCRFDDPLGRPCGECRACRALAHGNHPDLHRLAPLGAGNVIPIGGREDRGVRDLVRDLALMPVEGGARVAIITSADRMTEDAQSAFLKTLEEPPPGTVLVLTAADEERLLPTIRSRTVRIRLGPVARPAVEAVLVDAGLADAPSAARFARLAAGRPGDAVALARAPEAVTIRAEVARTLLDLVGATRSDRLRIGRDLLARTAALLGALRASTGMDATAAPAKGPRGRARGSSATQARGAAGPADAGAMDPRAASGPDGEGSGADAQDAGASSGPAARVPAAERRAAALALVTIWRDVARDITLVRLGQMADVRQVELLDDLQAATSKLPAAFAIDQLRRLDIAGERLEGNVSPELVIDALAIGWTA